jgi:hypothetical protein
MDLPYVCVGVEAPAAAAAAAAAAGPICRSRLPSEVLREMYRVKFDQKESPTL